MLEVKKYREEYKNLWDEFVENSKNGTFLFQRDFMEYHNDRFNDFSLMVFYNDKLVAVLPANKYDDSTIISHQGLTYGGFVFNSESSVNKVLTYIEIILKWLHLNNIDNLKIKHLPDFYSICSQQEIEYAYYLLESECYRMDSAFVFEYGNTENKKLPKGRKSEIKKAERLNVTVKESESLKTFWDEILTPNLKSRFGVDPVHNEKEITLLKEKFPDKIKQFNVFYNEEIIAGATIFETKTTAHVQYLAGNDVARKTGALDYLFYYLINYYSDKKDFFDFGIVNEENGKRMNFGMMKWKESFGTRVFLHKFFNIKTSNNFLLSNDKLKT